jgi:predicted small metal-binding protein
MTKFYSIACRDAGVDCDFSTIGESLEDVVEHCADHARQNHGMKGFGMDLAARMRSHIRVTEMPPVMETPRADRPCPQAE